MYKTIIPYYHSKEMIKNCIESGIIYSSSTVYLGGAFIILLAIRVVEIKFIFRRFKYHLYIFKRGKYFTVTDQIQYLKRQNLFNTSRNICVMEVLFVPSFKWSDIDHPSRIYYGQTLSARKLL